MMNISLVAVPFYARWERLEAAVSHISRTGQHGIMKVGIIYVNGWSCKDSEDGMASTVPP